MTQVSVNPADPPRSAAPPDSATPGLAEPDPDLPPAQAGGDRIAAAAAGAADGPPADGPPADGLPSGGLGLTERSGPIGRLMSFTIRKLAWSRLSNPRVAMTVSGTGLLLGMLVGATAPNSETLLTVKLPLSDLLSRLLPNLLLNAPVLAAVILYTGVILACLGLAGMLWAHSQGWSPDPRRLMLASTVAVAIMVCLTPVGSSDTASYAAYGRIASLGHNPYAANSLAWLLLRDRAYVKVVGLEWKNQPSVYGPVATWIQSFAARIGGPSVDTTIWVLMILNGLAFLGVGYLLLRTSKDPVRATLFWTANPVLIQQLVGGGHFDTFVAAAAIAAIQLARRSATRWGDIAIGLIIGVGCGIKITALLVAIGLAWPLLLRREWLRIATMALAAMAMVALEYSFYGLSSLKPLFGGSQWVTLPSPWWFFEAAAHLLGVSKTSTALSVLISCLWLTAMFIVAWFILKRISAEQPREVVAPFALTYAWVLVAPWVFAWYTALPWVAFTQIPRNRMSRWLTIVTALLAIWHSSGGWVPPGRV